MVRGAGNAGNAGNAGFCNEGDDRLASDYEEGNSSMQNPFGFTGLTPYFNSEYHWKFHISIQNSEGDYLYSDEDAERYYNHYLGLFFIAYQMAKHFDEDKRDYLKSNFTNIVSNLPLNDTFPEDIRECANKIYYDHKDEANTVFIELKRQENDVDVLLIFRFEDNGEEQMKNYTSKGGKLYRYFRHRSSAL